MFFHFWDVNDWQTARRYFVREPHIPVLDVLKMAAVTPSDVIAPRGALPSAAASAPGLSRSHVQVRRDDGLQFGREVLRGAALDL
jgi:hypothetical protein